MEKIEVGVRIRPLSKREEEQGEVRVLDTVAGQEVVFLQRKADAKDKKDDQPAKIHRGFSFNNCFGPDTQSHEIYESLIKKLVKASLNGVNGTVFAYGPTGSGKTYTMMGSRLRGPNEEAGNGKRTLSKLPMAGPGLGEGVDFDSVFRTSYEQGDGLIIMAVKDIFRQISLASDKTFSITCSFLEIYNDIVLDLLNPVERLAEELVISEVNNEFFTRGEIEAPADSFQAVLETIKTGEANRQYARTFMNHKSSRSHSLFKIKLRSISGLHALQTVRESILNFVDLAGSEKLTVHESNKFTPSKINALQNASNAKKSRVTETKYINKSLFFLTQVISQLSKGKHESHIPYRNSTLTKLLKSSLGGNAKTVVVLCVSPTGSQVEQTVSTLRFGLNVKKICNKVKSNSYETKNFEALQKLVSDYEVRIKHLEIEKLKEKNQSEELIEMIKRQAQHKKELTDKILSLENRVPTEVREELRETLLERSHEKEGLARILSQSSETVDHLKPVIEGQEREAECRQLRRANNHFMYKISKLRSQAAAKAKGLQGIEGLVRDLFSDQRAILSLEDVTLQKIKERCVVAVQKIDEQLISRKIQRRLNGVLRESVVQTVEEPCEDNLGLGKRGSRHGLLCPQSIKMIMDKSCLEGPRLYEDSLLPGILARYLTEEQQAAKIQPQCTGEAIAQPPEEQTDTSDIIEVEDNSEEEEVEVVYPRAKELVFNLGHLRNYIYRPQRAPPAQPNQAYEGNRAGELRRSSLMQTRNAILVDADCEGGLPAKSGMEEDRSVGSESNRGNIFQTGLSAERQPLLELSNKRSDHLKFASPKSQGTSLYFFTSKKNDFEFSFDRSAMLVEKNLELQYSRGKAGHQSLGKEN